MPERPLLFFPRPGRADAQERPHGAQRIRFPSALRQRDRITPQFLELERTFEAKLIHLQNNPAGLFPEQTLVLETVGSVDQFYTAVRRIHGLEWMGEFELEDVAPDEDFYDETEQEATLSGRVFLVLHNQEGLNQLRSLWETFQRNPEHPQFSRGRAKFRNLFRQLRTMRPWGPEDRLQETGLLEDWQQRAASGQEVMRVEMELWPRSRSWERPRVEASVRNLIEMEGGRILSRCEAVESIAYHALLAELPIQSVQRLIENPAIELAQCEQVMFFRPAGQILVELPDTASEAISNLTQPTQPAAGEPIAALLDGLPLGNHELLANRLIIDDPEGWEENYPADMRHHGTAMASLIIHSELDAPAAPLSRPLYVRPVMKPDREVPRRETIPPELLTVDLIQRAILRILEGDGIEPPAAPTVRIINISLGDRTRPFDHYPSPWARLLDTLAARHNVLFVVSAGNHPHTIELDFPRSDFDSLRSNPEELLNKTLQAIHRDNRHRRLLSPAEAINALTVGALHSDASPPSPLPVSGIDPLAGITFPALYNAQGLGFRRAVKPEIFVPGGRLIYREMYGTDCASLEAVESGRPPGQKVAAPSSSPSELSAVRYIRGTSNSAALVTRTACQLHEILEELRTASEDPAPEDEDLAILIRTLLVHGSSWGEAAAVLETHLNARPGDQQFARIWGFGNLDAAKVLSCTEQRVTLLGWGTIRENQAYAYEFPLPQSLSGSRSLRRLTTTIAWFSPIHPRHHRYRRAHVWLTQSQEGARGGDALKRLGLNRIGTEHYLARRGTVQHQAYEGDKAITYSEDETVTFQVNCRPDAGELEQSVRYGLAITLEVQESTGLSIYDEIRTRIRPPIAPPIMP